MPETHQFHDGETCFPGCPAWTSGGPFCAQRAGRRRCWQQLVDGVCPIHGDPDTIAQMMSDAEDNLSS